MMTEDGLTKLRATWAEKRGFTDEEALALIDAGEGLHAICTALCCEPRIIHRLCQRMGRPPFQKTRQKSPWNERTIAILLDGWDAGKSTAVIGREIGISKNAVGGRAARMGLTPRPDPINDLEEGHPDFVARSVRLMAPRHKEPKRGYTRPEPALPPMRKEKALTEAPKPIIEAPPPIAPTPIPRRVYALVEECCWPIGQGRTMRYCDVPTLPGEPYCEEHHAQAHMKIRAA